MKRNTQQLHEIGNDTSLKKIANFINFSRKHIIIDYALS